MKLGQRSPAAAWHVLTMSSKGPELSLQDLVTSGRSLKKFTRTSDLDVVFIDGDSARFGHEPTFIPPFPSANRILKTPSVFA